jgi:hypothetical protein
MTTVVCIPWRPTDDERRSMAFDWCWRWWQAQRWPAVTSAGLVGAFNLAAARNAAARQAIESYGLLRHDTLVFADADTFGQREYVRFAISIATSRLGAVYPHDHYWSLSEAATNRVLASHPEQPAISAGTLSVDDVEGPVNRTSVAGIIVCSVGSFETVGGFDQRFTAWGAEDVAFSLVCRDVLGSALRLPGHVWHLCHDRAGYSSSRDDAHDALLADYRRAALAGPHALRVLCGLREGAPWNSTVMS